MTGEDPARKDDLPDTMILSVSNKNISIRIDSDVLRPAEFGRFCRPILVPVWMCEHDCLVLGHVLENFDC